MAETRNTHEQPGGVESKVTAATVAAALAPATLLVARLLGWEINDQEALVLVSAALTVATPLLAFLGGYFKRSKTSIVSDGYVGPTSGEPVGGGANVRYVDPAPPSSTGDYTSPAPGASSSGGTTVYPPHGGASVEAPEERYR